MASGSQFRAVSLVIPLILILLGTACTQTARLKPKPVGAATAVLPPLPSAAASVVFEIAPLGQPVVSSSFGQRKKRMHNGIDFAAPLGSEVLAVGDGVVAFAGRMQGYGRLIELEHANGTVTRYAHLASFGDGVQVGASVATGTVIGTVGTSGRTTGPNLHFEVLIANRQIDPRERLPLE